MINYSIEIRDLAYKDVDEISDWYSDKSSSLSEKFKTEVILSLYKIHNTPLSFARIKKDSQFRRFVMITFPYKIYYRIDNNHIIVISVIHTSRSNRFIQQRLK